MAFHKADFKRLIAPFDRGKIEEVCFGGLQDHAKATPFNSLPTRADTPEVAKIREIRARIRAGFYDSPQVRDVVVQGLLRDLHLPIRP